MRRSLEQLFVSSECSIRDALVRIDRNTQGIVLVVDQEQRLLGTITDGDVRRAMLRGVDLNDSLRALLDGAETAGITPISAPEGSCDADLLAMMNQYGVRQIPIIAPDGRVVDAIFLGDLVKEYDLPLRAVIMAGGYGTRLRPLTDNTPKPMLPVGGRPLLQRTIEQLKDFGISQFNVTTHYKGEVIEDHFGDGRTLGVQIEYIEEHAPLGTAGALRMLGAGNDPLLIINGDILTQVNVRSMLEYHKAHKACLTVGVRQHDMQVPYGVVECVGAKVTRISEKPKVTFLVNAGVYVLQPEARDLVPSDGRFDMTDLIQLLILSAQTVVSFPIAEYWLDIGSPMDYEQAQRDVMSGTLPA